MSGELSIALGQWSDKGLKPSNQDFHGALIPSPRDCGVKGIAVAIADGISSSNVSHIAAEQAVKSFLTDYYCTSESWTTKTSGSRVIAATNTWLHGQNRRGPDPYERDKGYVCTFSALVLKSQTAHIFHVGDARIFRLAGTSLEQLTTDHRVTLSSAQSYLGRALGVNQNVEIDYLTCAISPGDVFVLATDGVYEHIGADAVVAAVHTHADRLDHAARVIVEAALANASGDNLTVQIVRVESVPTGEAAEVAERTSDLPPAPVLEPGMIFEGYRILRTLHASSRSHIYLAKDIDDGTELALKVPSVDLRGDPTYLKRFMMEEWAARRVGSAHVLKPAPQRRKRNFLYVTMDYIDGQTLARWMIDNPKPSLDVVRSIIEQIAAGLRAFHRMEMLHQDVRPANIMIDRSGTWRIIDFGSTRIAGVMEASPTAAHGDMLGTAQYTAPEYLVGDAGSPASDLYALGVIAYQLLTGRLPYGTLMVQARSRAQQSRIAYVPATQFNSDVPGWIDAALRKAVHPNPLKRQQALSEFTHDLRHPRDGLLGHRPVPLLERNPALVWQAVAAVLAAIVVIQAVMK